MEHLLKPRYRTNKKVSGGKGKLPAAGAQQNFTIGRIGNNNVKEELMCENAKAISSIQFSSIKAVGCFHER